ncbi:DUF3095 domain-containing protein [Sulfitobacter noctilucicola]|uniref:DUF3095 domain-containing protein n=1 Tax=Sulfitobacter noctilucicola TaxID=1342301 RepID=A0A7W6M578_9RHOB|nr:DUF3095 domain-containing protein [Sulfitobacter noctilucicola]MBB4172377.1 hypothetical protein [Sulfitobacter noctilucicola]
MLDTDRQTGMHNVTAGDTFYAKLPRIGAFEQLTRTTNYRALPQDWWIGVADIVDSTGLVQQGRYKTVNMVGAAVISALMNTLRGRPFPFVFGGDGAGFAVSAADGDKARDALAKVARWAETEFNIQMRVALVPVSDALAHGKEVRVARFQVSKGADYAMFDGGGLLWAEEQMKAGEYIISAAPAGSVPDLTGLSCRWSHMPACNGTILSVLVSPLPNAEPQEIARIYGKIVSLAQGLARGGHPSPAAGPGSGWPPKGAGLEAQATKGTGPYLGAKAKALFESFVAWLLIRTGWKVGGFDARRYARIVGENADFRKLDDGLKMTLDCDPQTQSKIEAVLEDAATSGLLRYGIATQDEAMMTCIVPSILTDDHVHFIDGAAGGYTLAAARMKGRSV